jgi:integrase
MKRTPHRMKFTEGALAGLKPDRREDGSWFPDTYAWDSTMPGFGVRLKVQPETGAVTARSYLVLYRSPTDGKTRRMALGRVGVIPLAAARDKAGQYLTAVTLHDADPVLDAAQPVQEPTKQWTMRDLADWYLAYIMPPSEDTPILRGSGWKKRRGRMGDAQLLHHYILCDEQGRDRLGPRRIDDITSIDMVDLRDTLRDRPTVANKVTGLLHHMMHLALQRGYRHGSNPCDGLGKMTTLDPRDRTLSLREAHYLHEALEQLGDKSGVLGVKLLCCTGMRSGEVLGLRWDDINWDSSSLYLRDTKTKPRTVYLGPLTLAMLKERYQTSTSKWICPTRGTHHLHGLDRLWEEINDLVVQASHGEVRFIGEELDRDHKLTPHDLRHTYLTRGRVDAGQQRDMMELLVGHALPKIVATYYNPTIADKRIAVGIIEVTPVIAEVLGWDMPENVTALRVGQVYAAGE